MKKFIALVVLLCAMMVPSTVAATEWSYIGTNSDGDLVYIDLESVNYDANYGDILIFHAFIKTQYMLRSMKTFSKAGIKHVVYGIGLIFFKNENGIKYDSLDALKCYDSYGNECAGYSRAEHEWSPIMPKDYDSIKLYNEVYNRLPR